jgi:hypothetical protein
VQVGTARHAGAAIMGTQSLTNTSHGNGECENRGVREECVCTLGGGGYPCRGLV